MYHKYGTLKAVSSQQEAPGADLYINVKRHYVKLTWGLRTLQLWRNKREASRCAGAWAGRRAAVRQSGGRWFDDFDVLQASNTIL